jgi:hypothetical protein
MRKLSVALAAFAALSFAAPATAATLQTSGFTLTGATGVDVNGTSYDVAFLDGTCTSVFDGCDSNSDFAFTNPGDATAAAQALLDQVFVDGLPGTFDTVPFLTNGCSDLLICTAWIPYSVSGTGVDLMTASNSNGADFVLAGVTDPSGDTSQSPSLVWAIFTPSVAVGVPEPSTWAMMLLGFGAIGLAARRRRKVAGNRHGCRNRDSGVGVLLS